MTENKPDAVYRIDQAIAAQEALRGILMDEQVETALAALRTQRASLLAQVGGHGNVVAQDHSVVAQNGAVAVGGNVYGDVYAGAAPKNDAEGLAIYRRVLARSCGQLPLRGVDVGASDPTAAAKPVGLANVYIDLDTTTDVRREKAGRGRRKGSSAAEALLQREEGEMRPQSALEAIVAHRQLALLGDPGSGKSTLVNHLAHCLALHALEPKGKWLDHLPGWPADEAELVPIRVILRDFSRALPDPLPAVAEPRHLWLFIEERLRAQNLGFAARPLRQALEQGRALLLLDGLDEVPTPERRALVRDAVHCFMERYPGNRFLVTCRVLSYQPPASPEEPDLRLPELPTRELAPFDEAKIDAFIEAWYAELVRLGVVGAADRGGLAGGLRGAVRRPDLWRLAPNPLLLTVMALVHTHQGRLPEARALLYEETVDILLWRWEQLKEGGKSEMPPLRRLLLDVGRGEVDLKRVLWRLAYEAHARTGDSDDAATLAGIGELDLEKALAPLAGGDRNWAVAVMETIKLRAGLLLERAPGIYGFPHRTFQEYLAGAHLAAQADFARRCCALAGEGAAWREAILLAAGRLVYLGGDIERPLALAAELCPAEARDEEAAWRRAWLAGDVLLEIGPQRASESALGRDLLARTPRRLVELLQRSALAPRERAEAGDTLARLGDPREEVTTLEGMHFCYVPPGPFWMGEDDEAHLNAHLDYGYWIGRYPVTVAQWRAYLLATDRQPEDADSLRDPGNRPLCRVSWHEAMAFCQWLTDLWGGAGLLPTGWGVRLPSEAEWEKAARGGEQMPRRPLIVAAREGLPTAPSPPLRANRSARRRYPWGDKADPGRANYDESRIGSTSAVGCFPGGASPYGAEELSGNLWEWTRSLWGKDLRKPDFGYPYDPADGREDAKAGDDVLRVVRGGSFFVSERFVRCAIRYGDGPDCHHLGGFRVVVVPISLCPLGGVSPTPWAQRGRGCTISGRGVTCQARPPGHELPRAT